MFNAIRNYFKKCHLYVPDTHLVTSSGVRMRKPYDKDGKWIGWTAEEIANHLANYKLTSNKK
jgi:hypothetical protein